MSQEVRNDGKFEFLIHLTHHLPIYECGIFYVLCLFFDSHPTVFLFCHLIWKKLYKNNLFHQLDRTEFTKESAKKV